MLHRTFLFFFHRALGVIPPVLSPFQAAHRGRYQRMSSGRWCLRLGLRSAASGSSRLQKRDARVKRGLHKDKSSPVKLRLFTGDNDKRKLDETRTSRGSDYAPSRSPSHRSCHLSPFSTDTRVKEEEEEKSRCALRKAREKVCARPY